MISRHTIRGRKELAQTATSDAVLLLITITMLVMRLHHSNNFYNVGGLLVHIFAHMLTCTFALVVLKFTIASSNLLRTLMILYVGTCIADAVLLFGFFFLYLFHDHKSSIDGYYLVLHAIVVLAFIGVDIAGAFFVDLSYNYIESLVYSDNGSYLHSVARQVIVSNNFMPVSAGVDNRVGSVHLTIPAPLAMMKGGGGVTLSSSTSNGRGGNSHLNV